MAYQDGDQKIINGVTYQRQGGVWRKQGALDQSGNPIRFRGVQTPKTQADTVRAANEADASVYAPRQAEVGIEKTVVDTEGSRLSNQKTASEIATATRQSRQNPISAEDQKFINAQRAQYGDMTKLERDISAAAEAVDRFGTSPAWGTLVGMGTVEDDDWLPTRLAKGVVGAFLPDQAQRDYQTLNALQNAQVLNSQIAQKGPQTEADAARMKLANISPTKNVGPNAMILAESMFETKMAQARPSFYTKWANANGSINALNKNGQSADEVWAQAYSDGLRQMRNDPRYRRVAGKRVDLNQAPRKGAAGWKIERIGD